MNTVLKFLLLSSVASATRPLAWENEDFVPKPPLDSTPEFLWDPESDPGGYIMYGTYNAVLFPNGVTADDIPYVPHDTLYCSWLLKVFSKFPPLLPLETWNCTALTFSFPSEEFLGEFNGKRICELGSCCQDWVDMGFRFAEDTLTWHKVMNDKLKGGMCSESDMKEEIYCVEVGGQTHINCLEMRVSPTEHAVTLPCMDNLVRYYSTHCPVFKTAMGLRFSGGYDSPIYFSRSTNEELISLDCLGGNPDIDICAPYSYYNPTSSTSNAPAASAEESSAQWTFSVMFAVFLL